MITAENEKEQTETPLIGVVEESQLLEWEKKHGEISEFITDDGKIAYFKEPDRLVLKSATDAVQNGISEYNEVIAENCFIGGDKSIITDPQYYNAVGKAMNVLASGVSGKLVKRLRKNQVN